MQSKKTDRQVRILNSIDSIRIRPGMYVGDTSTCNHLIHEAIDNALDEIRNKYGNSVYIAFSKNHEVLVRDNGRGLPDGTTIDENTGKTVDALESLFNKLHSGTKFSFENDKLESLFGMNGVGLVAVNALSDYVDITSKTNHYRFEDSVLVKKEKIEKDPEWSTQIIFKPSKRFFDDTKPDIQSFYKRLRLANSKLPDSTFFFNNKKIKKETLEEFVRSELNLNKETPIFSCSYSTKKMKVIDSGTKKEMLMPADITVFFTYQPGETILTGDVNLRVCEGSHINTAVNIIKSNILNKLDKKYNNTPERFRIEGLRLFASVQMPFPQFDSQTKTRMVTNLKADLFDGSLENKIIKLLGEEYIVKTVSSILNQRISNITKVTTKKKISADNKLIDCLNTPGESLILAEGDSALAPLRNCRDPNTEGLLPLRGKVINVEKQTISRLKDNKELQNIIEALGPYPYRYKTVRVIADSDMDGLHIISLIVLMMHKFFPEIITEGRLKVVLPPLYGGYKGDEFVPAYNIDAANKLKEKGYSIQRFKGLGEMTGKQMRNVLDSKIEYTVKVPASEKDLEEDISISVDADTKRKYLSMKDEYNFMKFISSVFESINKTL